MQVTPSSNLLNALSGLQANRRPSPAAGAASFQAAVQQSSGAAGTQATGTVQLKAETKAPVPPVNSVTSQPIQAQPRRASFLGQNLDITV